MTDDRRTDDTRHDEERRQDEELRADFQSLRQEVEASGAVPDFGTLMDRVRAEAEASSEQAAGSSELVAGSSGQMVGSGPTEAPRQVLSVGEGRGYPRLGWWIPLAAAAAVVGLLVVGGLGSDADADFERLVADYSSGAATWRSPTASLMDIPGVDLGAVPSIGGSLGGGDPPEADAPEGRDS